ncbi:hypothetical protein [Citricoccus sp. NR2]|uniref:hypothetical protein n=1 Tax=Citricoccus sp. NR2 TaxID=3004095 RepID=UPI0022DD534E|nr:hypothetical protein [Citricoccus sp. NR2]WBL18497.1 hypothetical protein O1A05_12115 [Citricoccus sp. NR2]
MPEFQVTWEGRVREIYFVEAEGAEEARRIWSDYAPDISESLDGEVTDVEEVGEQGE